MAGNSKIEVYEGAKKNLPDAEAHHAALAVLDLVSHLHEKDLLIVLVSGKEIIDSVEAFQWEGFPDQQRVVESVPILFVKVFES